MDIKFHKYILTPKVVTNRFGSGERSGVLFLLNNKYFADYHPWTQFGDLTVEAMLDRIENENKIPAFLMQNFDLDMKKDHIETHPFYNHLLVSNLSGLSRNEKVLKVKFLNDFDLINSILERTEAKVRIDFNHGSNINEILSWLETLRRDQKIKIDYLEDPIEFHKESMVLIQEADIKVASDRTSYDSNYFEFNIFKPNVDLHSDNDGRNIFSSYMGHDLGRYHSFLALMKWGDLTSYHGIVTNDIYEEQSNLFNYNNTQYHINNEKVKAMYRKLKGLEWTQLN